MLTLDICAIVGEMILHFRALVLVDDDALGPTSITRSIVNLQH